MTWLTVSRAIVALLFLVLVVGAGNLWATRAEVQSALAHRAADHAATCRAWRALAAWEPGPSRSEQNLHARFEQLSVSHGC